MSVRILILCGGSGGNLLGQRDALGVQAELQIDVGQGIRALRGYARDYYSLFVRLDRNVGTMGLVFREARNWIREKTSPDTRSSYIRGGSPDTSHLQLLLDYLPATTSVERGIALLPAIGGLAIRHPYNRAALEQALEGIIAPLGVGPENPIEVWIISSTVGGVGAGIHRFVGAFLADFVQRRYTDTPILLNFIRIGPLTYCSVNSRQTVLNAFFGVAADAAFALKLPKDFPGATAHWFYVDLPDVGTGERGSLLRARMIEVAAKVLMWDGIREDLQRVIEYNRGIPMVVARIGYWEKDLNDQRKYYEALRELQERLRELVEPDKRKCIDEGVKKPQFISARLTDWIERAGDEEHILQRMEAGWRFPRLGVRRYPESLEEAQALVEGWKKSVEELLGRRWEELRGEWILNGASGKEFLRVAEPGEAPLGGTEWFRQVKEAHTTMAWARYLLGCDLNTGKPSEGGKDNRLEILLTTARRISSLLNGFRPFKGRRKRAQEAKGLIREFVQTLAEVDALLGLEIGTRRFLEKALVPVRQVLGVAGAEFQKLWEQWAQPGYEKFITQETPFFSFSEPFNERLSLIQNLENLKAHLRQGWRLPAYWEFPHSLADVRIRVAAWKKALEELWGANWVSGGQFVIQRTVMAETGRREELQSLEERLGEQEKGWQRVENAHFVRAWVWQLLGCDLRGGQPVRKPGTLLEQLYRQAQRLTRLQLLARIPISWWLEKVGQWMIPILCEFSTILVRVDYLLRLEEAATNVLEQEFRGDQVVTVRGLSDPVRRSGPLTWFQALYEGIRLADTESFKNAVIQGINGLSERGLRQILDLHWQASVENIHQELLSRMGQMKINGSVVEAPWWGGEPLQASMSFTYLLLPTLPSTLQERLQNIAREQSSPSEYRFGFSELMPVAISIASMAQELGDVLTAPVALLKPFVPLVKDALSAWDYVSASGVPARQLEIAAAGVCGEPLYELAMRAAGLDDEELRRIGQYYTLSGIPSASHISGGSSGVIARIIRLSPTDAPNHHTPSGLSD